ncbi:MAG: sigma-54-dependent Fis family transcriptional regulator [Bdellovibrionales bacterium]|nr:sigma-54-dependent Fis family transcriptional regulator [Bdellovibrionales bacterium]
MRQNFSVEATKFVEPTKVETPSRRILIVDDDEDVRLLLKTNLEYEGFRVQVCGSLQEMRQALRTQAFDAVLLDIFLSNENGLDALPAIIRENPALKIIVMTGHGSVDLAVQAMRMGASNFLIKSSDPRVVANELKAAVFSQYGIAALRDEPFPENLGIVGVSAAMAHVLDSINRMKDVDSTVLVTGESGTGKELVARALHRLSNRSEARFGAINCGAIPENLLESELFGHKKSAFTDAKADRKGIFEVCSGGTLLLDEIGEMPLSLQVKLLRVLQEREITPIGSSEPMRVDVRVIASTNRDLEEEVRAGRFREDLFYRLSVLRVDLPPLRERREDIPFLVYHFISRFNDRFKKSVAVPTHEVMARLTSYDWPGNIRELQNAIERGVVLSRDNKLDLHDLFQQLQPQPSAVAEKLTLEDGMGLDSGISPYAEAKKHFEQKYLTSLLAATHGNISEASRLSGQYRTKIYRMMKRYNIDCDRFKHRSF